MHGLCVEKATRGLDKLFFSKPGDDIWCCSIVVMAFLGSVAVFACFSGAALVARRREYLFLGGILSSVVSLMLLLQFSSLIFGRSAFMYNVEV